MDTFLKKLIVYFQINVILAVLTLGQVSRKNARQY